MDYRRYLDDPEQFRVVMKALIAIDPLLQRYVAADKNDDAYQYVRRRFGDLTAYLQEINAGIWAVVAKTPTGKWGVSVYDDLGDALENADCNAIVCAARIEEEKLWLSIGGQFKPFSFSLGSDEIEGP